MSHLPENIRYILIMLAKGFQLSQWGLRTRTKSWGQAMLGTDWSAVKEGPEGHRLK